MFTAFSAAASAAWAISAAAGAVLRTGIAAATGAAARSGAAAAGAEQRLTEAGRRSSVFAGKSARKPAAARHGTGRTSSDAGQRLAPGTKEKSPCARVRVRGLYHTIRKCAPIKPDRSLDGDGVLQPLVVLLGLPAPLVNEIDGCSARLVRLKHQHLRTARAR